MKKLSNNEVLALQYWIDVRHESWRQDLHDAWFNGCYRDIPAFYAGVLDSMRSRRGLGWLMDLKTEDFKDIKILHEVHVKDALEICDAFSDMFKNCNTYGYDTMQEKVEEKYGRGAVVLALRALGGAFRRMSAMIKKLNDNASLTDKLSGL